MSQFPMRGLSARRPPRSGQRGVALAVALILLVVITLVGLAAVSGTLGQQKMSANFYDRQIAFQDTEAALREAALAVEATTAAGPAGFFDCSASGGNVCQSNPFTDSKVPSTNITSVSASTQFNAGGMAAAQPQYIIQYMGNFKVPTPSVKVIGCVGGYNGCQQAPQTADFYRITARSGDPTKINGRAYVLLQTVFRN